MNILCTDKTETLTEDKVIFEKYFVQSKSSKQLLISTFMIVMITLIISFTNIATIFDLCKLPAIYLGWMAILMVVYVVFIQVYKRFYIKKNGEWL